MLTMTDTVRALTLSFVTTDAISKNVHKLGATLQSLRITGITMRQEHLLAINETCPVLEELVMTCCTAKSFVCLLVTGTNSFFL